MASRSVVAGGAAVVLDGSGRGQVVLSGSGSVAVVGEAQDCAGNTATVTRRIGVRDPTDTTPPTVAIVSPREEAEVTRPTSIVVTASDGQLLEDEVRLVDPRDERWTHTLLGEIRDPYRHPGRDRPEPGHGGGRTTQTYARLGDLLLGRFDAGGARHVHGDHLGMVRALSDAAAS